jgi:hypothetical protein
MISSSFKTQGVKLRVEGDNVRITYENGQKEVVNVNTVDFTQCERSFHKFNDNKVKYYTGCKNVVKIEKQ